MTTENTIEMEEFLTEWENNDREKLQIQKEFIEFRLSKLNKKAKKRLLDKHPTAGNINIAILWEGYDSGVLKWVNFNKNLSWATPNKDWLILYKKETIYKNYCNFNGLPLKFDVELWFQLGLHTY